MSSEKMNSTSVTVTKKNLEQYRDRRLTDLKNRAEKSNRRMHVQDQKIEALRNEIDDLKTKEVRAEKQDQGSAEINDDAKKFIVDKFGENCPCISCSEFLIWDIHKRKIIKPNPHRKSQKEQKEEQKATQKKEDEISVFAYECPLLPHGNGVDLPYSMCSQKQPN